MTYDFDTPIDRHGTDSLKFDRPESRHRSPDLLSLWVADMDFRTPDEVIAALEERSRHGIFGYTEPGDDYFEALANWMGSRYGLNASRENTIVTPGVVFALATCIRAFTKPGDAVLVQRPVYYPFSAMVELNERRLANAPLRPGFDGYTIDLDAFERTIAESGARLFLLCNPHNPVGRAWTHDELVAMGEVCAKHDVIVVSDEIHMDFARPGFSHTSFATLPAELTARTITCTSASKTFNLAGLQVANIITDNDELRSAFAREMDAAGYSQPNTLGIAATQAAYAHGGDWLGQLKQYLEGNWQLLGEHLAHHAPELHLIPAETTYLAWIDCRALNLDARSLVRFIEDEAGLWLDCGHMFGPEGNGYIRINIATQHAYLERALNQLTDAVARRYR